MPVHTGYLFDNTSGDVPYMEETATGAEEDTRIGWVRVEERVAEGGVFDM